MKASPTGQVPPGEANSSAQSTDKLSPPMPVARYNRYWLIKLRYRICRCSFIPPAAGRAR